MTDHLDDLWLTCLRADVAAVAATVQPDTLDAPVAACPGWDLRALVAHLGHVHRWAAAAVRTAATPDPATIDGPPGAADELSGWLLAGGTALAELLASADPSAPTWHPFRGPQVVAVWRRRQAQETSVHRWDAQTAVGRAARIDPALAADGVGEYFEVVLPRKLQRDGGEPPAASQWCCVRALDVDRRWWVRGGDDLVVRSDPPSAGTAATVSADAEDLQLALFARRDRSCVEIEGDHELALEWLSIGGN